MLLKCQLAPILDNEALTRGLGDAEASLLTDWLVHEADRCTEGADHQQAEVQVRRLCRWARGVSRFLQLWCYEETPAAALQLAASERFDWPLPVSWVDPCELLERILAFQEQTSNHRRESCKR